MEQPHIPILKVFDDLKFNLGKRTLVDFIKGDLNQTIERNSLDELNSYGCLYMIQKGEITALIDDLLKNNFLELATVGTGFQVIKRTSKGVKEIFSKQHIPKIDQTKVSKFKFKYEESKITKEDEKLFSAFSFFLDDFNQEQKKAIISSSKNVLCIAGAGSGKTTVLTKRIDFLTKFRSVKQEKILAITFTRKAKQEMELRLNTLGIENISVETFNSFCEKVLKKYGDKIYDKQVRVAQYKDKIATVSSALKGLGVPFETFYDDYFNKRQLREKSKDDLFFIFVNDIFTVIDYFKNLEQEITPFYENATKSTEKRVSKIVCDVARIVEKSLSKLGLRDFSDQVIDCLKLYRQFPNLIPEFDHVLVDEYQDVNLIQVEFLKVLKSKNLFVVGDPRQAIYGWRGSEIKFIMDFPSEFKETEVIFLKKNYRSDKKIVDFTNASIKEFGLAKMEAHKPQSLENNIFLIEQDSELLERRFVLEAIKNSKNPRNEIFVLARTNKVLESYADFFSKNGVAYTIKSEEEYKNGEPKENEVVLATVHSIKGMEAEEVYLVSCNSLSFPNKVADNFVFSLMKQGDDYDKLSEELRLFYVALTRAKSKLVITYTGNHSKFVTNEMLNELIFKQKNKTLFDYGSKYESKKIDSGNGTVLRNMIKNWRNDKANQTGLPTYMILSNSAVEDLAKLRPQSKAEMYQVNGIGEMKIAKYGDELIRLINGG